MPPALFTLAEVAARARMSTRTLDNRRRAGTGPTITRSGTRAFVREDHLQEWLDRLTEPAKAAPGADQPGAA